MGGKLLYAWGPLPGGALGCVVCCCVPGGAANPLFPSKRALRKKARLFMPPNAPDGLYDMDTTGMTIAEFKEAVAKVMDTIYSYHLKVVSDIFDACNITTTRKMHAMRASVAQWLQMCG